ncbi:MAG: twin-arginine translocase TatA/TatE family subunit [Chloroflexi bacterium]|nr:twin-arginine translocase TatA/TatE family subunit [Chloroflexota bacterium]
MFRFGPTELLLILFIVLLLFGPGRLSKIAGELGTGLRAFREGLNGEAREQESRKASGKQA